MTPFTQLIVALIFVSGLAVVRQPQAFAQSRPANATRPASPPTSAPHSQPEVQRERLTIGGEEFDLEIAATPAARDRGLMDRDHIDEHGGMIFIYPQPELLSFWMKNCPIDMDILFIDARGTIVATHRMTAAPRRLEGEFEEDYDDRLPRYSSRRLAQFAIELQAGSIEKLKIEPGDKIDLDVRRLMELGESE